MKKITKSLLTVALTGVLGVLSITGASASSKYRPPESVVVTSPTPAPAPIVPGTKPGGTPII